MCDNHLYFVDSFNAENNQSIVEHASGIPSPPSVPVVMDYDSMTSTASSTPVGTDVNEAIESIINNERACWNEEEETWNEVAHYACTLDPKIGNMLAKGTTKALVKGITESWVVMQRLTACIVHLI